MTLEDRLDRLESVLVSAGEFLQQASQLAQQNTQAIDQLTVKVDRNTEAIGQLTVKIDSLAAASERHDRILDYLLGQQRGEST